VLVPARFAGELIYSTDPTVGPLLAAGIRCRADIAGPKI
jgi:hypothetical protein